MAESYFHWPSHDNNDRIYFGNSDVEVFTTYFKDIRENSDVKIDDALTECDMMQFIFMEGKLKWANINMNHTLLIAFSFWLIYDLARSTYNLICLCNIKDVSRLIPVLYQLINPLTDFKILH